MASTIPPATDVTIVKINTAILEENGTSTSLTFVKHACLPIDFIAEVTEKYTEVTRPLPERQLRAYIPNRDIHHDLPNHLELELGECIGHGRSGIVLKAKPVNLSPDTVNSTLPPLVVKIARQHYNKWLLREAWFYEEMQSIQGLAIPWCYGLYYARISLPPGRGLIPWLKSWGLRCSFKDHVSLDECLKNYTKYDGKDEDDLEELGNPDASFEYFGNFRAKYTDVLQQFEEISDEGQRSVVVALLILEEVGGPILPIGGEDWPRGKHIPKKITKEVYNAYDMMHELGIDHMDIKRDNILKAPVYAETEEQLDPKDSVKKNGCKCRIIDFEISRKHNFTKEILNEDAGSFLERLIENLPSGSHIGQNDG